MRCFIRGYVHIYRVYTFSCSKLLLPGGLYCASMCNRRKSDYISGCFVSVVACFKSVLPVKYGVLGQRMAVSGLPARFRPTGCGTGFRTRPPSDSWGYSTRQLLLTTLLLSLICI